jgi:hypothetical protein
LCLLCPHARSSFLGVSDGLRPDYALFGPESESFGQGRAIHRTAKHRHQSRRAVRGACRRFISLFGVAVLNGVVILSHFNQLRESGSSVREAVVEGSMSRMRAVLMTALLAMFGLLPMALSTGIGSEVQKPLAVVIIGGLISATMLSLILLPSLYLLYEGRGAAVRPLSA